MSLLEKIKHKISSLVNPDNLSNAQYNPDEDFIFVSHNISMAYWVISNETYLSKNKYDRSSLSVLAATLGMLFFNPTASNDMIVDYCAYFFHAVHNTMIVDDDPTQPEFLRLSAQRTDLSDNEIFLLASLSKQAYFLLHKDDDDKDGDHIALVDQIELKSRLIECAVINVLINETTHRLYNKIHGTITELCSDQKSRDFLEQILSIYYRFKEIAENKSVPNNSNCSSNSKSESTIYRTIEDMEEDDTGENENNSEKPQPDFLPDNDSCENAVDSGYEEHRLLFCNYFVEMLDSKFYEIYTDSVMWEELVVYAYAVFDYTVFSHSNNRQAISSDIIDYIFHLFDPENHCSSSEKERFKQFFDSRVALYGSVIRNKQVKNTCMLPDSLQQSAVGRCLIALTDLIIDPDCIDNYFHSSFMIPDISKIVEVQSCLSEMIKITQEFVNDIVDLVTE